MDEQFLYDQARLIADFITKTVADAGLKMEDWRKESVNPYYNQTEDGLFLEFYYGMPNTLWTPWGTFKVGGSGMGHFDQVHKPILEALGATLHTPKKVTKQGEFGPVYAIHKFEDIRLPEPKERDRNHYMNYEQAKAAWEQLTGKP